MVEIDKFGKQGVLKVIVGNKTDLEENRKVNKETAEQFAGKYGVKLWEVSAKNNTNIDEMFLDTIKTLLEKNLKIGIDGMGSSLSNNIVLNKDKKNNKKKKCC